MTRATKAWVSVTEEEHRPLSNLIKRNLHCKICQNRKEPDQHHPELNLYLEGLKPKWNLLRGITVKYASTSLGCLKNRNFGINSTYNSFLTFPLASSAVKASVKTAQKEENPTPNTNPTSAVSVTTVRIRPYPTRCPQKVKNRRRPTMLKYIS